MPFDGEKKWGGKYDQMVLDATEKFAERLSDLGASEQAESEIEAMLSMAFYIAEHLEGYRDMWNSYKTVSWNRPININFENIRETLFSENEVTVMSQVSLDNYRLDFLCVMRMVDGYGKERRQYLAIECDGHDFHERTKQQAARDKSRDRAMLLNGVPVMRFTGSEIWKDPFECIRQIDKFFWDAMNAFFVRDSPLRHGSDHPVSAE